MKSKAVVIIPSRYYSTRLPGKPLIVIAGKSIIQHVYERALQIKNIDSVIVATDDQRVADEVKSFNGNFQITPSTIKSGSERVGYIAHNIETDIIVNLQGDEPLISAFAVQKAIEEVQNHNINISTLACHFESENEWRNPSIVKVLVDSDFNAIYFSRSPIPYFQNSQFNIIPQLLRHIGVYVFRKDFLLQYLSWEPTPLEKIEKLEQLRIIEKSYKIKVVLAERCSPGIDTPEDVKIVEGIFKNKGQKIEV